MVFFLFFFFFFSSRRRHTRSLCDWSSDVCSSDLPLAEAFTGFFTDQHAFLLAKMLARVDALDADLAELDARLVELIAPLAGAVERLDEIPGVGQLAAHLLLAEIGADMTRFPTAGQLVSWAKFAPGF